VTGREAVRTTVGDVFTTFRGLRHALLTQCTDGERRFAETAVTHLVTDYHLYVDQAPVYA
jgi:hypothetical protein